MVRHGEYMQFHNVKPGIDKYSAGSPPIASNWVERGCVLLVADIYAYHNADNNEDNNRHDSRGHAYKYAHFYAYANPLNHLHVHCFDHADVYRHLDRNRHIRCGHVYLDSHSDPDRYRGAVYIHLYEDPVADTYRHHNQQPYNYMDRDFHTDFNTGCSSDPFDHTYSRPHLFCFVLLGRCGRNRQGVDKYIK